MRVVRKLRELLGMEDGGKAKEEEQIQLRYQGESTNLCPYLLETFNFKKVAALTLDSCEIGSFGCRTLSGASWPHLKTLNLSRNSIGNEGCLHLTKAKWKHLTHIILRENRLDDRACFFLTKGDWKGLSSLTLQDRWSRGSDRNQITEEGVEVVRFLAFLREDRELQPTVAVRKVDPRVRFFFDPL